MDSREELKVPTIPTDDLPLFWQGRAKALRILDSHRTTSDDVTLETARIYEECARELRGALAAVILRAAALSTPPPEAAGSAEAPVAWGWHWKGDDTFYKDFLDRNPAHDPPAEPGWTVKPLFARAQDFRAGIEAAAKIAEAPCRYCTGVIPFRDLLLTIAARATLTDHTLAGEGG